MVKFLNKSLHIIVSILSILVIAGAAIWVLQRTAPDVSTGSNQLQEATSSPETASPTNEPTTVALADTPAPQMESPVSKIVFVDKVDGHRDLYIVNPDGSDLTNLSDGLGSGIRESKPQWADDGSRIYFSIERGEQDVSLNAINPGGSGAVKLFDWPHQILSYDVSPDNQWVVYSAHDTSTGGNPMCVIYKTRINGSELTRLTDEVGGENAPNRQCDGGPQWSPDGSLILFISTRNNYFDGKSYADLYTIRPDGSNVARLTELSLRFRSARWSRDGQQIAFGAATSVYHFGNLYVMNAEGSNLRQLTNSTTEDERAMSIDYGIISWSPDGTQLVVSSDSHKALGLVDVATGAETYPLVPGAKMTFAMQPDWSPWLGGVPVTPTATPVVTVTATLTPTVTPEVTATVTLTPTVTPTVEAEATATLTPTLEATATAEAEATVEPTPTVEPTATLTPTVEAEATVESTATVEATATAETATIEGLISTLTGYCDSGAVDNQGVCNSLQAKLRQTQKDFQKGKPEKAAQNLAAFSHEVEAQQGKHISADAAGSLLGLAAQLCGQ